MTVQSPQNPTEAGVILVDKPVGLTSFKVVSRLRRILHIKKIGHAGTLDPFATGLLILCVGRPATKLISRFMDAEKEYIATLRLGVETESFDQEGKITAQHVVPFIDESRLSECLRQFVGEQWQTPPIYSALKHKGKPLYYYARKGTPIEKEPRRITVFELERVDSGEIASGEKETLVLRITCSKGTYIRSLASDIGKSLGCGAYLEALRRTRTGGFSVMKALDWEALSSEDALVHCLEQMIPVEDVCKLLQ